MMSMLNSLETRVPLLDHNLVEFVYSLPVDLRNHFGLKYIFKKTFKPMLPISIINKKKKGFSIPLRHWFNSKKNSLQKNTEINEYFISAEKLDNPVRIFQAKVLEQWL